MPFLKRLKKLFLPVAYGMIRLYWFIFRPTYRGAKIVLTCGDQVLLIRHIYGPYYWTFPGGSIDRGETPEQTIVRETKEELGITLEPAKVVTTGSFPTKEEYKDDTIYCFWAETDSLEIHPDEVEIAEARWFPLNEMPKELGAQNARKIFAVYQSYKKAN